MCPYLDTAKIHSGWSKGAVFRDNGIGWRSAIGGKNNKPLGERGAKQVVPHFEFRDLFGIVARGIAVEPCGSAKWTMASEIRKGRYIATLNVSSLLHPRRIVSNALPKLRRPAAFEMPCFNLP
jgi:hypothetical protein